MLAKNVSHLKKMSSGISLIQIWEATRQRSKTNVRLERWSLRDRRIDRKRAEFVQDEEERKNFVYGQRNTSLGRESSIFYSFVHHTVEGIAIDLIKPWIVEYMLK